MFTPGEKIPGRVIRSVAVSPHRFCRLKPWGLTSGMDEFGDMLSTHIVPGLSAADGLLNGSVRPSRPAG